MLLGLTALIPAACGARSDLPIESREASFQCADGARAGAVGCGRLTFADAVSYPAGAGLKQVVVADLNGDGALDLAVTGSEASTVTVLFNQGNGVFSGGVLYATSSEGGSSDLAAGDLNNDGAIDLVISPAIHDGKLVSVLLNDGHGAFAPGVLYAAGLHLAAVALGDLDGDGRLDIAAANEEGDNLSVLVNLGDGTFAPPVIHGPMAAPHTIAMADLDLDGRLDLVSTSAVSSGISFFRNTGGGTFASPIRFPGFGNGEVEVGDVNGDGWPDLAAANDVDVHLNAGGGTFSDAVTYPAPVDAFSLAMADVNGDCRPDLVLASEGGTVSVLPNLGDGTFGPADTHVVESFAYSVAVGDLDGDGKLDLAVSYAGVNVVTVLLNRGCAP